jgi:hypothetical protein
LAEFAKLLEIRRLHCVKLRGRHVAERVFP